MANSDPEYVPKITITGSRVDATVVLNHTRFGVTLPTDAPHLADVSDAVRTLSEVLIERAKIDIRKGLQLPLDT